MPNERSTAWLTVSFKDKAGALAAPASANYRVDCLTTGTAIRAETALTPASSIEITLTPGDNAIVAAANVRETRRVTIKAAYGAADEIKDQYDYVVENLSHAP